MPGTLIPFPVHETTLANGLRVIVVSTGFPNIVSLQIPVQTGSRNEVEPGKSGFAHFFEHMMFRGTDRFPPEAYAAILARSGARQNAYTTDDYTNYHVTCAREDLEAILEIEADRFMHLKYDEEAFKTESRAILGEYNKSASNPVTKLFEAQRDHAYTTHPYKHTTMGFLADIEDMPNQFAYSMDFFRRWYRPEHTALLIAGDLDAAATVALVEKHWGRWVPGQGAPPAIPQEPPATAPVVAHVPWTSPTLPWLAVAFHGPAFREDDPSHAALDMLFDLWFGETSDLYRRLVETDQVVDQFHAMVPATQDPGLAAILARLKDPADFVRVRDAILETCARARIEEVAQQRLNDARSFNRYALLRTFDNSEAVAAALARFARFNRSTSAIEALFAQYDALTPRDLTAAAKRFLRDEGLNLTTLAVDPPAAAFVELRPLASLAPEPAEIPLSAIVTRDAPTPQLVFKLQFLAGSADDPAGREGLAALAASMIAEAGSSEMRIDEITRSLFPIAGAFTAQVDREMTTFTGVVHADNFDRFADVVLPQLLAPGYRAEDFDRLKARQRNALIQDLRANNDEEFGKEILQAAAFEGTPYAHPGVGTVSGIDAITVEDARSFAREHYTRARLVLGLSGAFPPAASGRLRRALGGLPAGSPAPVRVINGRPPRGIEVDLVEKDTRSVAISIGHPLPVLRGHQDFPALWLARAALGDHRAFAGRLFQRIREVRGMNYGDYAYVEAFPGGMYRFFPDPNRARRAQLFEVWVRPVVPSHAVFALKLAIHEIDRFVRDGLSDEEFTRTRDYLRKNVYVMLQSQEAQLGYDLDGRWFGTGEFGDWMRRRLAGLVRDEVNAAIRRHLSADNLFVAMVTGDADALAKALLDPAPAAIVYDAPRDAALLEEDHRVGSRDLHLTLERIRTRKADEVFA